MAKRLSAEEQSEIKAIFDSFDNDGNGRIDFNEIKAALQTLKLYENDTQVKNVIAEVDTNRNGIIDPHEFLDIVANIKNGTAKSGQFALVYSKQRDLVTFSGAVGSHTFSEEEMAAFGSHINFCLKNDADVSHLLPVQGSNLDLCGKVSDGILLSKFINVAVKDTIDTRALNLRKGGKDIDRFKAQENQILCINSAKAIGVKVTNIGASELIDGKKNPHIVLGLVWQLVKVQLLNNINLKQHPELVRLLEAGEELADLFKLGPEALLLRWFNYHLRLAGYPKRVTNFSSDVKDSEAYLILLNRLGNTDKSALNSHDVNSRAAAVINNAKSLGVQVMIQPRDIVAGNARLNLIFTAAIFNQIPGLDLLSAEELSKIGLLEDDMGDNREERVFRLWINSLNIDGGAFYIQNLFAACADGLCLLKVLDFIHPGVVDWKQVEMNPNNKFKRVSNNNHAVVCGKKLNFSLVNISGVDITAGEKKLILGFVWQMMRYHLLKFVAGVQSQKFGNQTVNDDTIISWANSRVAAAGCNSTMRDFKDLTLGNGIFFLDLLYAIEKRVIDTDLVTAGANYEDAMRNARYAITVARKLGAVVFLLPEDIVEVKPKMILTFVASVMSVDKN